MYIDLFTSVLPRSLHRQSNQTPMANTIFTVPVTLSCIKKMEINLTEIGNRSINLASLCMDSYKE